MSLMNYILEHYIMLTEIIGLWALLILGVHPIITYAMMETVAPLKKKSKILLIPLLIYVPVIFTSQWTHWIFYITSDNHWSGNGRFLSSMPYYVFIIYALIFVVLL